MFTIQDGIFAYKMPTVRKQYPINASKIERTWRDVRITQGTNKLKPQHRDICLFDGIALRWKNENDFWPSEEVNFVAISPTEMKI